MGDGHGPWRRSCESLNEGERELWAGQWQMQTYKEIKSEKEPRLPEGRDGSERRTGRQAAEVPETRKPEQSRELAGGSHGQLLDVAHGRRNTKKPSSSELTGGRGREIPDKARGAAAQAERPSLIRRALSAAPAQGLGDSGSPGLSHASGGQSTTP